MSAVASEARRGPGLWELGLVELRLCTRSAGYRFLALVMMAAAALTVVSVRYGQPLLLRAAPADAEGLRVILQTLLLLLAPLVACGAAIREQRLGMDELILSRPPSSEMLAWGKLLGITLSLALIVLLSVVAAWIAQALLCRPDYALAPLLTAGFRVIGPLLFITGLSFSLALFFRSPLVAGLAVVVQIGSMAVSDALVPVLRFTLTPYHLAYALLGVALAGLSIGGWQRRREPGVRVCPSLMVAAGCLLLALGSGGLAAARWHGFSLGPDPVQDDVSELGLGKRPRLPDIPLPTATGAALRLSQWAGKPVVLVFWSTEGPDGAVEAAALQRAWRATAADRVGFASVCVTDDPGEALDVARASGLRAPVIINPPPEMPDDSHGLAEAFGVNESPHQAVAGVIPRFGPFVGRAEPVSRFPPTAGTHPPHPAWEQRLAALGREAFPQLAERGR